ncbi:MAG: hypothetical protein AAF721_21035 [Myxococcota bacterium]
MRLSSSWKMCVVGAALLPGCGDLTQAGNGGEDGTGSSGAQTTVADGVDDGGPGPGSGTGGMTADGTGDTGTPSGTTAGMTGNGTTVAGATDGSGTMGVVDGDTTSAMTTTGMTDPPTGGTTMVESTTTSGGTTTGDPGPSAEDYEECYSEPNMGQCMGNELCVWDSEGPVCEPVIGDDGHCLLWDDQSGCEGSSSDCSWSDKTGTCGD